MIVVVDDAQRIASDLDDVVDAKTSSPSHIGALER